MYLFIGKGTSWSDDANPPSPTDSVANTHYENWRDMLAAKKVTASDVSHVIPRKNWTNNTSYFAYTHNTATLHSSTRLPLEVIPPEMPPRVSLLALLIGAAVAADPSPKWLFGKGYRKGRDWGGLRNPVGTC